ncbi:MAG: aryldialkylphosphatase, partial [Planctomycetota bacterium]
PTLELLVTLLDEFPDRIMLGMDAARPKYWISYGGGPGLSFLLTTFSQRLLKRGVPASRLDRIFVTTPAATYRFATPAEN